MNNKKWIWAMAVCAPQLALAQSSVTVYGVLDMAISSYRGEGAGSRQMLTSSGNQSSRLGFRGREVLGAGWAAGFDLESGLNPDNGTGTPTNTNNQPSGGAGNGGLVFSRKSLVYLESKDWGQLRLGRDYTPAFWNLFVYDPFRVGVGMSGQVLHGTTSTAFRASNSIGYYSPGCSSPQCKGWHFQGMYALGENADSTPARRDGNLYAWRLGYGGAHFEMGVASSATRSAVAGDYTQHNIGGAYELQKHRLMFLWGENQIGKPQAALSGADRVRFWQLGAWVSVGQGYIPVSYMHLKRNDAQGSTSRKLALGYVHPLSKRTSLYGTYTHITNTGTMRIPVSSASEQGPMPVAGGNASGVDLGIRHAF